MTTPPLRKAAFQTLQTTTRLRGDDILAESLQRSLQEVRLPPVVLLVPRVYLLCTWRGTAQVSALMYLAGSARRAARREGVTPGGTAGSRAQVHPGDTASTRADGAAGAACRCRPGRALACAARYAALGAVSALVPGSPAASGAGAGAAGTSR